MSLFFYLSRRFYSGGILLNLIHRWKIQARVYAVFQRARNLHCAVIATSRQTHDWRAFVSVNVEHVLLRLLRDDTASWGECRRIISHRTEIEISAYCCIERTYPVYILFVWKIIFVYIYICPKYCLKYCLKSLIVESLFQFIPK